MAQAPSAMTENKSTDSGQVTGHLSTSPIPACESCGNVLITRWTCIFSRGKAPIGDLKPKRLPEPRIVHPECYVCKYQTHLETKKYPRPLSLADLAGMLNTSPSKLFSLGIPRRRQQRQTNAVTLQDLESIMNQPAKKRNPDQVLGLEPYEGDLGKKSKTRSGRAAFGR